MQAERLFTASGDAMERPFLLTPKVLSDAHVLLRELEHHCLCPGAGSGGPARAGLRARQPIPLEPLCLAGAALSAAAPSSGIAGALCGGRYL
jgi:hypothetical protein